MKLFNNTWSYYLAAFGLSLSLAACGGGDNNTQTAETTQPQANTQATSDKALVVAVTQDFAPFTYLNESGEIVGFDVDVVKAIAKNKGLDVKFQATSFDNIFKEVQEQTVDIGTSGIFYTENRVSKYGLTKPYHMDQPVYFYRSDNEKLAKANPKSLADLNAHSLKIAIVGEVDGLGSHHNIIPVKSEFLGFVGVLQNKYDVSFSDGSVLQYMVKSHLEANKIKLNTVPYQGEVGYVMIVNKDNKELLQTLNEGMDELTKSGAIKELRQKYGLE